jgi:hypothetical protein
MALPLQLYIHREVEIMPNGSDSGVLYEKGRAIAQTFLSKDQSFERAFSWSDRVLRDFSYLRPL